MKRYVFCLISALLAAGASPRAQAADLAAKKPASAEYVKTCPAYGAGFFVVPGTTSCLRVWGRVRFEYIFDNPQRRADNDNRLRARGYFLFDHRVATEYGLLRTMFRGYYQRENANADTAIVDFAYIQFGGLTVGRLNPAFYNPYIQFFSRSGQYFGPVGPSDDTYATMISYSHQILKDQFLKDLTVTVAADSQAERRAALRLAPGVALAPGQTVLPAGQGTPDFTLAFEGSQSIFKFKLAGALHPVRGTFVGAAPPAAVSEDYGYAFFAGAKADLSMLRPGTNVWASFNYAMGAPFYTHYQSAVGLVGARQLTANDAVVDGTGRLRLTRSWSVGGAAETTIIPSVVAAIGGFYGNYDENGLNNTVQSLTVAGHLSWRPSFGGLLIGTEVLYRKLSNRGTTAIAGGGDSTSDVTGRIRFQREF